MQGFPVLLILPAPEHWDNNARLGVFVAVIGLLLVQHSLSTLFDDKGGYLDKPFGYGGPLSALVIGVLATLAGAYFFLQATGLWPLV
jgi:hypothetical protein